MFLSSTGIKASHTLINMLNDLPQDPESALFPNDCKLLPYLSKALYFDYAYNMDLNLDYISHVTNYDLPLRKGLPSGVESGVYAFIHTETGYAGIGSALSFESRLTDHLRSFKGSRDTTFMHN